MDEAVRRAMARWPQVPAVYGWLALDRRGQWLIRGETIGNAALRDFIARNYVCDEAGRYAFQNGPQRVYVTLHYTPWVASLDGAGRLRLHDGQPVTDIRAAWMDEQGSLLLDLQQGIALVDDRDLDALGDWLVGPHGEALDDDAREARMQRLLDGEAGVLTIRHGRGLVALALIQAAEVPLRFGFVQQPCPPPD